jgi:hypothetical protein
MIDIPKFYRWGGGGVPSSWSLGWETGKDNDLICASPHVATRAREEHTLSPVCSNRLLAFICTVLKIILLRLDRNLRDQSVLGIVDILLDKDYN